VYCRPLISGVRRHLGLAQFPKDLIRPLKAVLTRQPNSATIVIDLEPFELPNIAVESDIVLDGIALNEFDLEALEGQVLTFPVNPDNGYIDGSLYIEHAHHPVDVTKIEFDAPSGPTCLVSFTIRFLLSFEGLRDYDADEDYEDFDLRLTTKLAIGDA